MISDMRPSIACRSNSVNRSRKISCEITYVEARASRAMVIINSTILVRSFMIISSDVDFKILNLTISVISLLYNIDDSARIV
ncbi:hypothetical protein D3C85_1555560 [compost metagenome]